MLATALPPTGPNPIRMFGRFELRRLLGRSSGTMTWLAFDPRRNSEVMLTLPRVQPLQARGLEHSVGDARLAARLRHPNLALAAEVGVHDHWPFVAVDRTLGVTLEEWLAGLAHPHPTEVVGWVCDVLRGLAFAHEAGIAHRDLQLHSVLIDPRGGISLMATACAGRLDAVAQAGERARANERTMAMDPADLRDQRVAAARDVLACGVLLHQLLIGRPALEQRDTGLVIERIAPRGRELVRLPWSTPRPIPEALRAIANRATSGQERLRYRNARTFLDALTGWLDAESSNARGPVGVLLDRLHSVGHLPALPGLAARVARVTSMESRRTDEIADEVLEDMALTFELLRTLNSAQVQGTQAQGNGPVLTLRRIVSLIGVNGVRLAANTLRAWPGPLSPPHAAAMHGEFDRVRLAGLVAQALRPRGYDAQVVFLITALQNLGRLMLSYHFADEAGQIVQLMRPAAADRVAGTPEQPGLSESAAAFAVLGVDIETLGTAVARHWGLGEEVMHMARRQPADTPVHKPDSDAELLRLTASAANDAVDACCGLTGPRSIAAIDQVAQRYSRALGISARDITDGLQAARDALRKVTPLAPGRPGEAPADRSASARDIGSANPTRTPQ